MKASLGIALGTAGFVLALLALPALAGTITEREKRDCQRDYHAYCNEYGLGTEALRACMSRNIKKISHACVGALVDAGEMTKAQADKLHDRKGRHQEVDLEEDHPQEVDLEEDHQQEEDALSCRAMCGAASRDDGGAACASACGHQAFLYFAASSEPLVASPAV